MKKQILVDDLEQLETKEYTKLTLMLVPENWGDFLELCKTLNKVFIPANEYYVEFNKLRFYMDGTVEFNGVIIKIVVGVSCMWQIIKNLVGEK